VAEAAPKASSCDQEVKGRPSFEILVTSRVEVADDGVSDVCIHVEGSNAGRPVGRALLPGDRSPRERRALEAQLTGPLLSWTENRTSPFQRVLHRGRIGIGEDWEHERLGVPK
jgi:hypothetical protein